MKYESGIRVTWRPPPNNERNGPLTGYIVSMRVCVCMHVSINVHIRDYMLCVLFSSDLYYNPEQWQPYKIHGRRWLKY